MRNAVVLFSLFLGSCGESGPPTRGVPIAFNAVCEKANEGKRVMLEGYVSFPSSFKEDDITVMMRMRPSMALEDTPVGVSAKLGNAANNLEKPPDHYRKTDLKLHLADGQVVGYTDKLKVSGTMYYPSSIAHVEFKCGLSNTLYERGQ
ncbi:MAG TPA: hypothetical protein VKU01_37075 [Bryobacteraceae bacterium]|nr:hypothetical protein [Bryobacteraceae bacterium]